MAQGLGIFISYRREDVPGQAGRLYDRLSLRFGESHVFMDVDSIELGVDFTTILQRAVESCEVMLVLIGPRWVSAENERGVRRLDDPDDYVRMEVQAALDRAVRVVPVLAQGADLPSAEELPEPIQPLVRRQALELGDVSFSSDASLLIERLAKVLTDLTESPGPPPPHAPTESSWQATCQRIEKISVRRLEVTLTESSHLIEYQNRALLANEVRLDGNVVGKKHGVDNSLKERYEFTVSDGPETRTAVVDVQLRYFGIKEIALTVDGRELYRGA